MVSQSDRSLHDHDKTTAYKCFFESNKLKELDEGHHNADGQKVVCNEVLGVELDIDDCCE